MAPNNFTGGKAVCGEGEKSKSEAQEIITRINDKIDHLYDILRPVYLDNSEPAVANEKNSSQLVSELQNIEDRITRLLDGIRI